MKLDSNFNGFSVNEASFRSQVEGSGEGKRPSGAGGAKKVCCGRGCCQQGRQKISLDNLSSLLKNTSETDDSSKKDVPMKSRHAHKDHFEGFRKPQVASNPDSAIASLADSNGKKEVHSHSRHRSHFEAFKQPQENANITPQAV